LEGQYYGRLHFQIAHPDALRRLDRLEHELAGAGFSNRSSFGRGPCCDSAVARLEGGEANANLSTVGRYAAALGKRIEWRIVDQETRGTSGAT